jgi:hypothetical protein
VSGELVTAGGRAGELGTGVAGREGTKAPGEGYPGPGLKSVESEGLVAGLNVPGGM